MTTVPLSPSRNTPPQPHDQARWTPDQKAILQSIQDKGLHKKIKIRIKAPPGTDPDLVATLAKAAMMRRRLQQSRGRASTKVSSPCPQRPSSMSRDQRKYAGNQRKKQSTPVRDRVPPSRSQSRGSTSSRSSSSPSRRTILEETTKRSQTPKRAAGHRRPAPILVHEQEKVVGVTKSPTKNVPSSSTVKKTRSLSRSKSHDRSAFDESFVVSTRSMEEASSFRTISRSTSFRSHSPGQQRPHQVNNHDSFRTMESVQQQRDRSRSKSRPKSSPRADQHLEGEHKLSRIEMGIVHRTPSRGRLSLKHEEECSHSPKRVRKMPVVTKLDSPHAVVDDAVSQPTRAVRTSNRSKVHFYKDDGQEAQAPLLLPDDHMSKVIPLVRTKTSRSRSQAGRRDSICFTKFTEGEVKQRNSSPGRVGLFTLYQKNLNG